MIWLKLVWKLFKIGLKSKRSGKAVQWVTLYQLALDGLSETLQKAAPPGTTVLTAIDGLQEYMPAAQKLIDHPPDGKFDAENPNRAVYLMAESLETGITRNFLISARTLQQFDELSKDPAFTGEQKEKLAQMCVNSYLVGLLAPVMQLDIFERELDDLLLETRCKPVRRSARNCRTPTSTRSFWSRRWISSSNSKPRTLKNHAVMWPPWIVTFTGCTAHTMTSTTGRRFPTVWMRLRTCCEKMSCRKTEIRKSSCRRVCGSISSGACGKHRRNPGVPPTRTSTGRSTLPQKPLPNMTGTRQGNT